jgi:hypothetical protein
LVVADNKRRKADRIGTRDSETPKISKYTLCIFEFNIIFCVVDPAGLWCDADTVLGTRCGYRVRYRYWYAVLNVLL